MPNGDIILNTEDHGVVFFNKSKLVEHHQQLSLKDISTVQDQRDKGYSATWVFTDRKGYLTILSESEADKKLSFTKRDSSNNYEEVGAEYQEDRPHPIMKINIYNDGECV